MGKPVLTDAEWDKLRALSLRGVPDKDLALEFSVREGTIAQRRRNDAVWLTLWQSADTLTGRSKRGGRPALTQKHDETSGRIVSASLDELASQNPLLLANYTHSKIKEAIDSDSIAAPQTWGELKTASEIFRKAVGLDKEQAPVQINLWSGQQEGLASGPVIDLPPDPAPETWV
jgi:hypothetical protein